MKRALLAATAVLTSSFTPILISPAYADVPPVYDTSGLTPQEVCDAQLRPNNPNSEFQTQPENSSGETLFSTSDPVRDSSPFDQVGTGTPTYDGYGNFDATYHRNGGSPNVWTGADANTKTYPTSDLYYHTTVTNTYGETFDCVVFKDPGGDAHGPDAIYPAGLQSFGNSAVTRTEEVAGPDQIDPNGGPLTDSGSYYDANVLICISPNSTTKAKPGTWTGKHGFSSAQCAAASLIAGGTVPSGNAP
jgi:hypothetical protein